MSVDTKIQHIQDALQELEEKRKNRSLTGNKISQNKKGRLSGESFTNSSLKFKMLLGLCALGVLSVAGTGICYVCDKVEQRAVLSEQEHVRACIARVDKDIVQKIRQKYDSELLMLINGFQTGDRLNGCKMAPYSAVFMAHSHLLSKYNAYDPDVRDKKRTIEDWVLLDHMNYRYYQYKAMKLSNVRGETKNPYSDMLHIELMQPAQRINVRHHNLFEGLKLDNVMKL